jgi:hypothetical protein
MDTSSFIRAHLQRISNDAIFSRRDFLCYGTRAAVDVALHRLVKKDVIVRLARGVFVKWSLKIAKGNIPSALEIAQTKARAFGKEIFVHKRDAAAQLGLVDSVSETPTFGTFGRSTSFQSAQRRIKLSHICLKDAKYGDTFIGLLIRGLRYIGYNDELPTTLAKLTSSLTKAERAKLSLAAASMPSWLSDLFYSENIAILKIKSLTAA